MNEIRYLKEGPPTEILPHVFLGKEYSICNMLRFHVECGLFGGIASFQIYSYFKYGSSSK
jgi:hypothetical protein